MSSIFSSMSLMRTFVSAGSGDVRPGDYLVGLGDIQCPRDLPSLHLALPGPAGQPLSFTLYRPSPALGKPAKAFSVSPTRRAMFHLGYHDAPSGASTRRGLGVSAVRLESLGVAAAGGIAPFSHTNGGSEGCRAVERGVRAAMHSLDDSVHTGLSAHSSRNSSERGRNPHRPGIMRMERDSACSPAANMAQIPSAYSVTSPQSVHNNSVLSPSRRSNGSTSPGPHMSNNHWDFSPSRRGYNSTSPKPRMSKSPLNMSPSQQENGSASPMSRMSDSPFNIFLGQCENGSTSPVPHVPNCHWDFFPDQGGKGTLSPHTGQKFFFDRLGLKLQEGSHGRVDVQRVERWSFSERAGVHVGDALVGIGEEACPADASVAHEV